jgi:2-keto-4-pentenoate hydratase/2-oxohepta-3-ene-1,7-dioic acid hydratase in catechol pathway
MPVLWGRIEIDGSSVFGIVEGGSLHEHEGNMFSGARPTGKVIALEDAKWLTPCTPSKFLALWNNFHAAAEKNGWSKPAEPLYFIKTANSFTAHGAGIPAPTSYDGRVMYEGELGVVIGRETRAVTVDEANAHIFGYTCVNDVTALELLHRDASFPQWTRAKNFDGFGAFGSLIATDVDAGSLSVRTLVNGRERQNYPVADMIFSPAQLVSLISQDMTLLPGDIIACGTSLGALPMKPGTTVEVSIEGVAVLQNTYGAAP